MFQTIVVPLDGSPTAAHVLSYLPLVVAPGARVTLVGVVTPLLDAPWTTAREKEAAAEVGRASAFLWQDLEARAQSLRARGFPAVTSVRTGDLTTEILGCARAVDADLIALTTHGTSSVARWMLGSSTRRLLRKTTLPTLVFHAPAESAHQNSEITSVLVPLDGSPLAEASLAEAAAVATRHTVPLRIIRVVSNQTPGEQTRALNDTVIVHRLSVALEQACDAARRYVASTIARLQTNGCGATGTVRVGDPAAILSAALAEQPDALLVIATHGPDGDNSQTFGSIAETLVATASNPALILRPLAGETGRIRPDPALAARYPD